MVGCRLAAVHDISLVGPLSLSPYGLLCKKKKRETWKYWIYAVLKFSGFSKCWKHFLCFNRSWNLNKAEKFHGQVGWPETSKKNFHLQYVVWILKVSWGDRSVVGPSEKLHILRRAQLWSMHIFHLGYPVYDEQTQSSLEFHIAHFDENWNFLFSSRHFWKSLTQKLFRYLARFRVV